MQSGLNANQYTSQMRILDVDDNRSGYQTTNDVAISKTPWEKLQPYSLICIGGSDQYWMASRGINPNDRPLSGCVLEYLMDEATSIRKDVTDYTAFERGVNAAVPSNFNSADNRANIRLTANVTLAGMKTVDKMKECGFFLPTGTLAQMKAVMTDMSDIARFEIEKLRKDMGKALDETGFFNKFIPDSTVISSTFGDGDKILNEIDQASGFSTFGTKIQGHAFVSQCTTKLKCRAMDTVYVVIRAKALDDRAGGIDFTSPEMCFLTSAQLKHTFRETNGNFDAFGDKIRNSMTKSVGVRRDGDENYVVMGGWKLGKVVDIHAIPVGDRRAGFVKGLNIYEIMLNIEQCTAFEFIRHIM